MPKWEFFRTKGGNPGCNLEGGKTSIGVTGGGGQDSHEEIFS